MEPKGFAKETKETLDILDDIHEIDEVLSDCNSGNGFDDNKARKLIAKHNSKDVNIRAYNNTPGMSCPLQQLSPAALYHNLIAIRGYLFAKRIDELRKAAEKETQNHANP